MYTEKRKESYRKYYNKNKEKIKIVRKAQYNREKKKDYYNKNKEGIKEYYNKNRERIMGVRKEYLSRNRKKINDYRRNWRKDTQVKLSENLRTRLCMALKGNYRNGSAVQDLGCTIPELKIYLQSQFKEGMTWNNHGNRLEKWSIDHIIPLSLFDLTDRSELLKAVHYTNLQPLWHVDNQRKGNKYENKCNTIPKNTKMSSPRTIQVTQ